VPTAGACTRGGGSAQPVPNAITPLAKKLAAISLLVFMFVLFSF
jgi:hypothetical protein